MARCALGHVGLEATTLGHRAICCNALRRMVCRLLNGEEVALGRYKFLDAMHALSDTCYHEPPAGWLLDRALLSALVRFSRHQLDKLQYERLAARLVSQYALPTMNVVLTRLLVGLSLDKLAKVPEYK
jgi:hypothetical protein